MDYWLASSCVLCSISYCVTRSYCGWPPPGEECHAWLAEQHVSLQGAATLCVRCLSVCPLITYMYFELLLLLGCLPSRRPIWFSTILSASSSAWLPAYQPASLCVFLCLSIRLSVHLYLYWPILTMPLEAFSHHGVDMQTMGSGIHVQCILI